MPTLPVYKLNQKCKKCRSNDIRAYIKYKNSAHPYYELSNNTLLKPYLNSDDKLKFDVLVVSCNNCQHSWLNLTADANKK